MIHVTANITTHRIIYSVRPREIYKAWIGVFDVVYCSRGSARGKNGTYRETRAVVPPGLSIALSINLRANCRDSQLVFAEVFVFFGNVFLRVTSSVGSKSNVLVFRSRYTRLDLPVRYVQRILPRTLFIVRTVSNCCFSQRPPVFLSGSIFRATNKRMKLEIEPT